MVAVVTAGMKTRQAIQEWLTNGEEGLNKWQLVWKDFELIQAKNIVEQKNRVLEHINST